MADSSIEQSVLDKPVGSLTQVKSSSGFHLIEVLSESMPAEAGAAAMQKPQQEQQRMLRSASVQELASVLQDTKQVRSPWVDA
jgi:parvulin-like peptidyl-prolyl isomerase